MRVTFIFDNVSLSHQPLGSCYISAVLKEAGHSIAAVNVDEGPDYVEKIVRTAPDILAFSTTTSQMPLYLKVNRELRREYSCFSLFGGHHPTFFPQMIEEEGVDAICVGEGEYPMLELLDLYESGKDYTGIAGMNYNMKGKIITNPPRPFIDNKSLNQLPFPDRELIRDFPIWKYRIGYVIAGRGCPYDCSFCFNHVSRDTQAGRWTRLRSVDNVIAELKWLKDVYKVLYIAFQDDTFILNRRWLREFLPRYGQEVGLPFMCNVRCDLTDEEEAQLLSQAGCIRVAMGIENGMDDLRQKILAKNISTEEIQNACDLYYKYGIRVMGQNMIGVPGETVESTLSTIELNIRARTHINMFSFFQPFPGTKLAELCSAEYGFSGDLNEIPREYQDKLADSIRLNDKELIEKIGQCAHLFTSYPRVFWFTKKVLPWLPSLRLKLWYLEILVRIKRELLKKGEAGLPAVWHQPKFIMEAVRSEQPDIPIQSVGRENRREAA